MAPPKKAEILKNAKEIVKELRSGPNAFPAKSAYAAAGNFWIENYCRPMAPKGEPRDHGSEGLAQWRLGRLVELKKQVDWQTIKGQIAFFKMECKRDYPALWDDLISGEKRLETLVANICDQYERPSVAGRVLDKRIAKAKDVKEFCEKSGIADVPKPLQPVVAGPGTSLLGLLCWAYSYILHARIDIGLPVDESWGAWAAIGAILIFLIGAKQEKDSEGVEEKESNMDVTALVKIVDALGTIVPVLEKYAPLLGKMDQVLPMLENLASDFPNIKNDVEQMKNILAGLNSPDSGLSARVEDLVARIQKLGSVQ